MTLGPVRLSPTDGAGADHRGAEGTVRTSDGPQSPGLSSERKPEHHMQKPPGMTVRTFPPIVTRGPSGSGSLIALSVHRFAYSVKT